MNFEECIQNIHEGSVIDFQEYVLNRHEKKQLTLSIKDGVVQTVFPANERLSRDILEKYYGTELSNTDYLQLSLMNCPRIVVSLGLNSRNELDVKVLILNKDFYNMGLQKIDITNELPVGNEPNYLLSQGGW